MNELEPLFSLSWLNHQKVAVVNEVHFGKRLQAKVGGLSSFLFEGGVFLGCEFVHWFGHLFLSSLNCFGLVCLKRIRSFRMTY